jgi:murein DD-endopeptidase MepM/ murein hydrolase activator NlpD
MNLKLATRIFNRERGDGKEEYYLTSPFGKRVDPITGKITYHNGCDYGTHGNKWAQYALEDGVIENVFIDQYGAKDIWVKYDRLGYRCLHGHLDSFNVKKGQKVNHNTILGYTGMSGKATGIHLHLGVKYIGQSEWINPESIDYQDKPSPYPFNGIVKKGSNLYTENGTRYKNPASKDRQVQVLKEKNNRYKVYGDTFNPHVVYVNKGDVIPNTGYPFDGIVKKGSPLYNEYGSKYKNGASADREVKVEGEVNGRYKVYGSTFNPHIVYVDKGNVIKK